MFMYGSSDTFFEFACAEVLGAISLTFRSGAFQAWLVDNLRHHGHEGPYNRIFGRESLFNQVGGGGGAILGAYMATGHPSLPWFVGGSMAAIVGVSAFIVMKEEYFVRKAFSWRKGLAAMRDTARASIRYGSQDKAVRFILVVTFVQIYAVQALNMYWQPFFKERGLHEAHLGFLFFGVTISLALGAFLASRAHTPGNERATIVRAQVFVGVVVIVAALSSGLPALIICFLLHEVGRGHWRPTQEAYLHERIPSHERATIMSFCSVSSHLGGAIGLLISGGIAQLFGISASWVVAGSALILGTLLVKKNNILCV
jgi:predicted MFS family arabinose efflux permease